MTIMETLRAQLGAALWECCPSPVTEAVVRSQLLGQVVQALLEDAHSFAAKDPASAGNPLVVVQTYTSFRAVLHYRLAHALHTCAESAHGDGVTIYAPIISSRGKLLSGAELDHRCSIGRRFIIDHGVGTVVGETSVIGDDCYLLGGVTLGACGIAGNHPGPRHPRLGNRVQVGAFSRIFGTVCIGDDSFIGPHCTITQDIAARSRVTLRSSLQVVSERKPVIATVE